jgi:hypothetical protein
LKFREETTQNGWSPGEPERREESGVIRVKTVKEEVERSAGLEESNLGDAEPRRLTVTGGDGCC